MSEPGRKLSERGHAVRAPDLCLGLLQALVGLGELISGCLSLARLHAVRFGQLVCQVTDHRQNENTQDELEHLIRRNVLVLLEEEEEREKFSASEERNEGGYPQAEVRRRGNHRQQQDDVEAAGDAATLKDQRVAQCELQDNRGNGADARLEHLHRTESE